MFGWSKALKQALMFYGKPMVVVAGFALPWGIISDQLPTGLLFS
jgi:hypothetical protein